MTPRVLPPLMLAFGPRKLRPSASEENAGPSHLVERNRAGNPASPSWVSRAPAGSLSCFLRLHHLRLVAVPAAFFHLSLASATVCARLLDHSGFRRPNRLCGG